MNKTIIINISGIIFHIEEDAYEILKVYINDVKRHFAQSPDSFEIVTDIENRIAELFNEILKKDNKQVIVKADVETIIAQMGTINDFTTDEDAETNEGPSATYNIKRRLFRDEDDKTLGGVCSGVAAFFGWEAVWVRIVAAVLLFVSFGTMLFIYILLWIVIPAAKTRAEKLAMKGEPINLENIKRSVEDELGTVKNHFSAAKNNVESSLKNNDFGGKVANFFNSFFSILGEIIKGFFKIFGVLLGAIILFACLIALVSLVGGALGVFGFSHFGPGEIYPFNMFLTDVTWSLTLSAILVVLLPLIGLILIGFSLITKKRILPVPVSIALVIIWFAALSFAGAGAAKIAKNFKQSASLRQTVELSSSSNNNYILNLSDVALLTDADLEKFKNLDKRFNIQVDGNEFDFNNVKLTVEKSITERPILIQVFKARGRDFETALDEAQKIKYTFSQQDSVLTFNSFCEIDRDGAWRDQQVDLTLQLPLNSTIIIDHKMSRILNNLYTYRCSQKQNNKKNTTWIMTDNGLLCVE